MKTLQIITILWLIFMTVLSHIGGTASAEESKWLSAMTGLKEGLLRRWAHVVVFIILSMLTVLAWPEASLWVRIVSLAAWAVIDETSKALPIFPGRHCSGYELLLNLVGCVLGVGLGLMIGSIGSIR